MPSPSEAAKYEATRFLTGGPPTGSVTHTISRFDIDVLANLLDGFAAARVEAAVAAARAEMRERCAAVVQREVAGQTCISARQLDNAIRSLPLDPIQP